MFINAPWKLNYVIRRSGIYESLKSRNYKGEYIALRKVDFLVHDIVTVELKARTQIEDVHLAQAINYLEASSYPIGLLINFGAKSLQFKRLYNKSFPINQTQSNES